MKDGRIFAHKENEKNALADIKSYNDKYITEEKNKAELYTKNIIQELDRSDWDKFTAKDKYELDSGYFYQAWGDYYYDYGGYTFNYCGKIDGTLAITMHGFGDGEVLYSEYLAKPGNWKEIEIKSEMPLDKDSYFDKNVGFNVPVTKFVELLVKRRYLNLIREGNTGNGQIRLLSCYSTRKSIMEGNKKMSPAQKLANETKRIVYGYGDYTIAFGLSLSGWEVKGVSSHPRNLVYDAFQLVKIDNKTFEEDIKLKSSEDQNKSKDRRQALIKFTKNTDVFNYLHDKYLTASNDRDFKITVTTDTAHKMFKPLKKYDPETIKKVRFYSDIR
ncbi:hypothetical protein JZM24_09155 [Candidatus Sodalis endolongispinus]|uniref:Uncharacterized protein n=1 Tax=Candidatus Sodalis endolongispinus TaxID=2812662 RepID=A0ABS5YDQ9_9GAMM|nr:hypothetical protein [Candidatus Sodalis endolongispinus]MBT9432251.1 hypothetical protein [Candidatus Sodalis endolongispinus]